MAQPTSSNSSVDSTTKKQRVSIACVHCRKRKIKCVPNEKSLYKPCERCVRRGFLCEYISVGDEQHQTLPGTPPPPPPPQSSLPLTPTSHTPQTWGWSGHSLDQLNDQIPNNSEYRPHAQLDRSHFDACHLRARDSLPVTRFGPDDQRSPLHFRGSAVHGSGMLAAQPFQFQTAPQYPTGELAPPISPENYGWCSNLDFENLVPPLRRAVTTLQTHVTAADWHDGGMISHILLILSSA
ncbi:hypothetical protein FB451DRAFT_1372094 [Mycena latifolia]|nr:hypothetical protein FB451DRAFT_1372094 [Mycena latifolia]